MSSHEPALSQPQEAQPELRYHTFKLDIPPDGCYLFTFSCPERQSTYFNALMVRHGQVVGLTQHTPVLLSTSEDPVGGLAIGHLILEDGSMGGPGFAIWLRNPERATMSWEPDVRDGGRHRVQEAAAEGHRGG
jgi:hypothetical protein